MSQRMTHVHRAKENEYFAMKEAEALDRLRNRIEVSISRNDEVTEPVPLAPKGIIGWFETLLAKMF